MCPARPDDPISNVRRQLSCNRGLWPRPCSPWQNGVLRRIQRHTTRPARSSAGISLGLAFVRRPGAVGLHMPISWCQARPAGFGCEAGRPPGCTAACLTAAPSAELHSNTESRSMNSTSMIADVPQRIVHGQFRLVGAGRDGVQPDPRHRCPRRPIPRQGHHQDVPSTADQRGRSDHPFRPTRDPTTTHSLASCWS